MTTSKASRPSTAWQMPVRATSTYYSMPVDQTMIEQSNRDRVSQLTEALAYWIAQDAAGMPAPATRLGRPGDRVADVADQGVDKRLVVRLAHDPNDRLGARRADDEPAAVAKPRGRLRDRLRDGGVLQRLAAVEPNVAQHLRQRLEAPADFARRLAEPMARPRAPAAPRRDRRRSSNSRTG